MSWCPAIWCNFLLGLACQLTAVCWNWRDLFVNEATLTGETFPVEKILGNLPADTPLTGRTNALFRELM